ncbi:hypothetical protein I203_100265 [Kwoniella mangroviensis CBS 8507]|uniref:uncharacterized protein n=1 Tax=Kwoniella mangroviensis CBS 8507 TaxID=1296122 RepID=UPI00080CDF3A|nr:uncharacterized protein I203_05863 [Kwoniella mangroviensis CBS 8507]OCF65121.1 hypothetical protein I203_05863 [Kwoniella mangroviensis CBS 8507]
MSPFDLSCIGSELDTARRSRAIPTSTSPSPTPTADRPLPALSSSVESDTPTILDDIPSEDEVIVSKHQNRSVNKEVEKEKNHERPYPLCLLCLDRPPSAVLLPCCHLNLCYICAPLLIHRFTKFKYPTPPITLSSNDRIPANISERQIESETETETETDCSRIPYNQILYRATLNHPKSRKLGLGGYRPPVENHLGGEYTGQGILRSQQDRGKEESMNQGGRIDMSDTWNGIGRQIGGGDDEGPKCLVCRAGVQGWLRVYTG